MVTDASAPEDRPYPQICRGDKQARNRCFVARRTVPILIACRRCYNNDEVGPACCRDIGAIGHMTSVIFHGVPDAAAPPPSARYSHAVQADGWLYVTGQLPVDPRAPGEPPPEGIEAQAELCFVNLRLIAAHAGYALSDTVFARIYLRDFAVDYAGFNHVYDRHFSDPQRLPARTTIGVVRLGRDARVEIDLVLFAEGARVPVI